VEKSSGFRKQKKRELETRVTFKLNEMIEFLFKINKIGRDRLDGILYTKEDENKTAVGILGGSYNDISTFLMRLGALIYTKIKDTDKLKFLNSLKYGDYNLPIFSGDRIGSKSIKILNLKNDKARNKKGNKESKGKSIKEV